MTETAQALVQMSSALDANTAALHMAIDVLRDRNERLDQIHTHVQAQAKAQTDLVALEETTRQRARDDRMAVWGDVKGAVAAVCSHGVISGTVSLAVGLLAVGAALWVLSLLGVPVDQVVRVLPFSE